MKVKLKEFYKTNGLTEDTPIQVINIGWLVTTYGGDYKLLGSLMQAITDGEVETVGDAIQYMDNYY